MLQVILFMIDRILKKGLLKCYEVSFDYKFKLTRFFFFKFQYPLGLFDCNETKTADVIKLFKKLQQKYVPHSDGEICEPVLFGGKFN